MASDGRASIVSGSFPCRSHSVAKKVSSLISVMTTRSSSAFKLWMRFLVRSCVIGRDADTFSISLKIAFASKIPTQIGMTVSEATSLSTTMGILVDGSIIRPRILTSTDPASGSARLWRTFRRFSSASSLGSSLCRISAARSGCPLRVCSSASERSASIRFFSSLSMAPLSCARPNSLLQPLQPS